jgi:uncharacterized protein (DUF2249 family)
VRQNLLIYLLTGRRPDSYEWEADGREYDPSHLIAHLQVENAGDASVEDVVNYLLRFNLGTQPHEERVKVLVEFVNANGGTIDRPMLVGLLSLIAAMPEYQLC